METSALIPTRMKVILGNEHINKSNLCTLVQLAVLTGRRSKIRENVPETRRK
jgi:hypothetical protein